MLSFFLTLKNHLYPLKSEFMGTATRRTYMGILTFYLAPK